MLSETVDARLGFRRTKKIKGQKNIFVTHLNSIKSCTEYTLLFLRITSDYVFWRDDTSMKNTALKFILVSSFLYDPI